LSDNEIKNKKYYQRDDLEENEKMKGKGQMKGINYKKENSLI